MAALNMYNYVDVFKSKDVKGADLLHLDKDKLLVSAFSGKAAVLPQVRLNQRVSALSACHGLCAMSSLIRHLI